MMLYVLNVLFVPWSNWNGQKKSELSLKPLEIRKVKSTNSRLRQRPVCGGAGPSVTELGHFVAPSWLSPWGMSWTQWFDWADFVAKTQVQIKEITSCIISIIFIHVISCSILLVLLVTDPQWMWVALSLVAQFLIASRLRIRARGMLQRPQCKWFSFHGGWWWLMVVDHLLMVNDMNIWVISKCVKYYSHLCAHLRSFLTVKVDHVEEWNDMECKRSDMSVHIRMKLTDAWPVSLSAWFLMKQDSVTWGPGCSSAGGVYATDMARPPKMSLTPCVPWSQNGWHSTIIYPLMGILTMDV